MEVFEVHITGDEKIHEAAKELGLKTIAIDLLRPDNTVLRTEHMTSHVYRCRDYMDCLRQVTLASHQLGDAGVKVRRVKIESPYYDHYRHQSLYMESHFEVTSFFCPTSKNQKKDTLLGTDRVSDKGLYDEFREHYKDKEVELCLYDSDPAEDKDWFDCYKELPVS